jgi:hypothetical protein
MMKTVMYLCKKLMVIARQDMEAKIPTVNLILHPQKLKPNNSQG